MKKYLFFVLVLFAAYNVFAQNTESSISQLDNVIKDLAVTVNRKLVDEKVQKVSVSRFVFGSGIVPFGNYMLNQLVQELANTASPYIILPGGTSGAEWIISGEIIQAANVIRVYTRLIRQSDMAIAAVFNSDFERTPQIIQMLVLQGGGSSSSSILPDSFEPDSWDNPAVVEIGADETVPVINRSIHEGGDEDFFLIVPEQDGRLTAETTGSMDTYMYLYNADTREELASNDDGGSNTNARIVYNVRSGQRYIAKVRGYSSDNTGNYGFRGFFQQQIASDQFEPDDDFTSAHTVEIGTSQQHTFHYDDDIDWVKFEITQAGRYTIRTRGVNSNSLDTYIELFNADLESIAENDDGGDNLDSRISQRFAAGFYYLKISCLGDDPDQSYTVSITAE